MTTTSIKRQRSPAAYLRKDARNIIYAAMYGKGDRASTAPPAFDPFRVYAHPDAVNWADVKLLLQLHWSSAMFDGRTALKILNDFNHYARGAVTLGWGGFDMKTPFTSIELSHRAPLPQHGLCFTHIFNPEVCQSIGPAGYAATIELPEAFWATLALQMTSKVQND